MAANSGKNYVIAYKEQSVIGTPVSGAAADAFTTLPSPGGRFSRQYIESNEDRPDGQSNASRLGVRQVSGSYSAELKVGAHDKIWEAILRGTFNAGTLVPGTTRRAYTIEEYFQDIDKSLLFEWCRWTSFRMACPSDGMATVEFGFFGRDAEALATGDSPNFTTPTISSAQSLVSLDGTVLVVGSPVAMFTGIEFAGDRGGSVQSLIGTDLSPDVFDGRLRISGTASMAVQDLDFLSRVATEDQINLALTMTDPDNNSMTVTLGRVTFGEYGADKGGDQGMIATTSFTAGYDSVLGGMIKIENSFAS